MESLPKSEWFSDEDRRLLLEIMFAGINHNLLTQVHAMLPALPLIVLDKKLQAVCRALLLAGLNEPLKARQILERIDLPEAKTLRPFFQYPGEIFKDEHH